MLEWFGRLAKRLSRSRPENASPPGPAAPPAKTFRHLAVHPGYPVTIGDEAARRLMEFWWSNGDPLGLMTDAEFTADHQARTARFVHVVRAALSGVLAIGPDHRRVGLHPVTRDMLSLCGIDPDAYAVISAFSPGGGLYVDGADGWTVAKTVDDSWDRDGPVHVRVRVPGPGDRPRLVWWQEADGNFRLSVPRLFDTVVNALPGLRLSAVLGCGYDPVIVDAAQSDGNVGPATLIRMRPATEDDRPTDMLQPV